MRLRHHLAWLWAAAACGGPPVPAAPAASESAPSPQGTRFMLDTFEREVAENGVPWSAAADANGLGTTATLEIVSGGADSKGQAARFHGHLGKNQAPWPWASLALNMTADYAPADLRAVRGLRFWARGDGKTYKVSIHKDAANDFANYEYSFVAAREWKLFSVSVEELAQPSWGKRVPRVFDDSRSLSFAPTQANADFELFVDDVELIVDRSIAFPWKIVPFVRPPDIVELAAPARRNVRYHPVPLAKVANRALVDEHPGDGVGGWTDQGENSLLGFPTGARTFLGVPFRIAAARGKQVLMLRGRNDEALPTRVEIPVARRGKAVYFLHASAWGSKPGGSYQVRYDDGTSEDIVLRDRVEVFDFWHADASPYARTAWRGTNPSRAEIGVTLFAWRNPHPAKQMRSIVAATPGHGAYLGVLGITVASDGPYLPPVPVIRLDDETWFPYSGINVAERRGTALDASSVLDAPAGKHGALTRQGENFVFADGTKVRFWGMSITDQMNFPSKQEAEFIAELCAQLGFNMTRHHLLDAAWSKRNIFGAGAHSTQNLDAERLDAFDYLIAELIRRGIYINLDYIAQRKPLGADGVQEAHNVEPGYKLVGQFDEVLIRNQERFIEQLMRHKNPYTGKTYAEDPAIAMASITNESSLLFLGGTGQGELRSGYHQALLKKLYNAWLVERFGPRSSLEERWAPRGEEGGKLGLTPEEDPETASVVAILDFTDRTREYERYSAARVRDNYTFLYDVERSFHERLTKTIRATGFKGLVTGTNHWLDQPLHQYLNSQTDWVDAHVYYSLPSSGYQYRAGVGFAREPALKSEPGLIQDVAARRVAGTAFSVSEWSSLQPVFRNEALVMMMAYSGLHNWSPLMYSLGGSAFSQDDQPRCKLDNVFELKCQGGILALWPALSRSFHRRDVKESPQAVYRPITTSELFDPSSRLGLPTGLAYVAKTGVAFVTEQPSAPTWGELLGRYVKGKSATSITGELYTDWGRGLFKMDTPRAQAVVGATGGLKESVSNLAITVRNPWATVVATSLDDRPLAKSARVLVSAAGNAVNRGMTLATSGTTWKSAGSAPVLLEPMIGRVELTGLTGDTSGAVVHYLTISGARVATVPVNTGPGMIVFDMKAGYATQHYEVLR